MAGRGEGTKKHTSREGGELDWLTLWAIGRYDLGCSELEFWELTLQQFNALAARFIEHHDRLEYYAALSPWATYNVYRNKDAPMFEPTEFMFRRRARLMMASGEPLPTPAPAKQHGTPAILLAPVPTAGVRHALPGERPPSRFSAEHPDNLIDRYDAWVTGGMRRG
jgi:hypothetical protein